MPYNQRYGELSIDHRASPGLTPEQARALGYEPTQVAEGKLFEAATKTCAHCGTVVVLNPLRVRERATCYQCMDYICDLCDGVRRGPDYVHMPRKAVVDLVQSGKFTFSGSDVHPVLTKNGDGNG